MCDNGRVLAVIKRCLPDPGGCITGQNPCLPGDGSGPLLDRRISTLRVRELLRHVAPHFSLAQVPVAPSSSAGNSLHTPLHPRHHISGAETILKKRISLRLEAASLHSSCLERLLKKHQRDAKDPGVTGLNQLQAEQGLGVSWGGGGGKRVVACALQRTNMLSFETSSCTPCQDPHACVRSYWGKTTVE